MHQEVFTKLDVVIAMAARVFGQLGRLSEYQTTRSRLKKLVRRFERG